MSDKDTNDPRDEPADAAATGNADEDNETPEEAMDATKEDEDFAEEQQDNEKMVELHKPVYELTIKINEENGEKEYECRKYDRRDISETIASDSSSSIDRITDSQPSTSSDSKTLPFRFSRIRKLSLRADTSSDSLDDSVRKGLENLEVETDSTQSPIQDVSVRKGRESLDVETDSTQSSIQDVCVRKGMESSEVETDSTQSSIQDVWVRKGRESLEVEMDSTQPPIEDPKTEQFENSHSLDSCSGDSKSSNPSLKDTSSKKSELGRAGFGPFKLTTIPSKFALKVPAIVCTPPEQAETSAPVEKTGENIVSTIAEKSGPSGMSLKKEISEESCEGFPAEKSQCCSLENVEKELSKPAESKLDTKMDSASLNEEGPKPSEASIIANESLTTKGIQSMEEETYQVGSKVEALKILAKKRKQDEISTLSSKRLAAGSEGPMLNIQSSEGSAFEEKHLEASCMERSPTEMSEGHSRKRKQSPAISSDTISQPKLSKTDDSMKYRAKKPKDLEIVEPSASSTCSNCTMLAISKQDVTEQFGNDMHLDESEKEKESKSSSEEGECTPSSDESTLL